VPKAILEFDLNEYDDRLAHLRAMKATDAYIVIQGIHSFLRNLQKHKDQEVIDINDLLEKLNEIEDQYGIDLSDCP
jgi:microsomal dipeptidase-like Zn-dependent dipeptidase